MTVPARISVVTLGVADVARSRAFYEALGWRATTSSMDQICWFSMTGSYLGIFGRDDLAADARLKPGSGFGGVTLAINVESEAEVGAALAAAEKAGATIIKPAERADWGGYSGYFADLDGYPWEVAHNPHFPLDQDGRVSIP